jgi:hypothetical protein
VVTFAFMAVTFAFVVSGYLFGCECFGNSFSELQLVLS